MPSGQHHVHPTNRIVPVVLRPQHEARLRKLLDQGEFWVRRGSWRAWLDEGSDHLTWPVAEMRRDERIAAAAWIVQQQHLLHRVVVGDRVAPEGWAESLPLTRALRP